MTNPVEQKAETGDISQLDFVRLKIPRLIPVELIDAVKGRTFTADQFYKYQESQIDSPYNYLYALIDESKKIHGYLWAESNLLDGTLFVNTFSIDKKYWGKGKGIEKAVEFLRTLKDKIKAPRVYWLSTNERFFLKHGFKRSKMTLLEYNAN
jgi:N-acetylglutamate synthase-like GNAT family acetyltransferase